MQSFCLGHHVSSTVNQFISTVNKNWINHLIIVVNDAVIVTRVYPLPPDDVVTTD